MSCYLCRASYLVVYIYTQRFLSQQCTRHCNSYSCMGLNGMVFFISFIRKPRTLKSKTVLIGIKHDSSFFERSQSQRCYYFMSLKDM